LTTVKYQTTQHPHKLRLLKKFTLMNTNKGKISENVIW